MGADAAPLPIIVGVTGHRDLRPADIPDLEPVVAAEIDDIQARYPHSSLVILSPLAEGADRLVARVALDRGLRLVVPLPFSQELYEHDFSTASSREEFRHLLARASGCLTLPLLHGHSLDRVREHGPARDREYAKLGAFIASSSQVLMALWDGMANEPEKLGGTAQVVRFRLEGLPAEYDSLRSGFTPPIPVGPVHHVVTRRQSHSTPALLPFTRRVLVPRHRPEASFTRLYARMNAFNRDAADLSSMLERTSLTSQQQLLNVDSDALSAAVAALPPGCEQVLGQYAVADGLAVHFAGKTLSTLRRVFVGVGISALLFHIHAAYFHAPEAPPASVIDAVVAFPWTLVGFPVCSAVTAVWFYGRAEKAEYQTKYQDYRALAEVLRIQFYWRVAGVSEPVVDRFLRKQRSELDWIRGALGAWHLLTPTPAERTLKDSLHRVRLLTHWIGEQRAYFVSKARKEQATLDRERFIASIMLKLGAVISAMLVAAFVLPLVPALPLGDALRHAVASPGVHHSTLLAIGIFGVMAALLRTYGEQRARAEHVRQFTRMSELFDAGERELVALGTEGRYDGMTALVRELGLEALEDSAEWLILHRERPLELPHG